MRKGKEFGKEYLQSIKGRLSDVRKKKKIQRAIKAVPLHEAISKPTYYQPWYMIQQKQQMEKLLKDLPKEPKCECYKRGDKCKLHNSNAKVVEYDQTNVSFIPSWEKFYG